MLYKRRGMRQASNLGEELDEGNWGDFYFVFLVHLPHFLRGSFLELSDKVQYLCPKYSSPRLFTEIVGYRSHAWQMIALPDPQTRFSTDCGEISRLILAMVMLQTCKLCRRVIDAGRGCSR
jgi:hypothetical protein